MPSTKHCCRANDHIYEFLRRWLAGTRSHIGWNFDKIFLRANGKPYKHLQCSQEKCYGSGAEHALFSELDRELISLVKY